MRVGFTDMREMCCCGPGARTPCSLSSVLEAGVTARHLALRLARRSTHRSVALAVRCSARCLIARRLDQCSTARGSTARGSTARSVASAALGMAALCALSIVICAYLPARDLAFTCIRTDQERAHGALQLQRGSPSNARSALHPATLWHTRRPIERPPPGRLTVQGKPSPGLSSGFAPTATHAVAKTPPIPIAWIRDQTRREREHWIVPTMTSASLERVLEAEEGVHNPSGVEGEGALVEHNDVGDLVALSRIANTQVHEDRHHHRGWRRRLCASTRRRFFPTYPRWRALVNTARAGSLSVVTQFARRSRAPVRHERVATCGDRTASEWWQSRWLRQGRCTRSKAGSAQVRSSPPLPGQQSL
jgi:hypothetical protein